MTTEREPLAVVAPEKKVDDPEKEKDLLDYTVGDPVREVKITAILYATPAFLIFRNDVGGLGYIIRDSPIKNQAQAEFHKWRREVDGSLRGAYREDSTVLLASCLASCLLSEDVEVQEHFEPVRLFVKERGPIEYVYGYSADWIVYLNNRREVSYDYSDLPARLVPAMAEFTRLWHISRCSLSETDQAQINSILGSDLAASFRSPETSDQTWFLSSRDFVTNRSEAIVRSAYIKSSVVSSGVLLLLVGPVCDSLKRYGVGSWPVFLGCCGGIIGATISIIQRGVTLTINPFVPLPHVVFQGLVRVLLGVVFGSLLVVASKANITLGILENNVWSLFIFSVVAGFSERFMPDILERIATEQPAK